ncbi:hypothetical protein, partial [Staphylococcus intermedius]
ERNLRNLNGQRTLLNYSEIRSKTAQYLGYISSDELYLMTPKEWQDWIRGARERELDMLEHNVHLATANAMAQSKKGVKPMKQQIKKARENLFKDDIQIRNDRQKEIEKRKMIRQKQIEEAEAFFGNQKGGN